MYRQHLVLHPGPRHHPRTRRLVSVLFGVLCSVAPGALFAQPKQVQKPEPGAYTHDGFYLRFATGFGAYDEWAYSASRSFYEGRLETRARGFAVAGEFAMGGTPFEGLVIGGGAYSMAVYTSSITFNREVEAAEQLGIESRDFSVVGVFIDRYFVPSVGVHAQAAFGMASQLGLTVDSDALDENDDSGAVGVGAVVGLGYEMWIARELSLGVLARFGAGVLYGKDRNDVPWLHVITTLPAFLMTVTYH